MRVMRRSVAALLYMAVGLSAIPAGADPLATAAGLRDGDMRKLVFHEAPKSLSNATFDHENGDKTALDAFAGKWVLLNFWATWCAPCRHEMPMLSELQTEFGGEAFEVVTIATGRNPVKQIEKFFAEVEIDNLPKHRDPKQKLAGQMGIFGLPITVLISPEGQEVARLRGDADWASDSAKAIIAALTGAEGS